VSLSARPKAAARGAGGDGFDNARVDLDGGDAGRGGREEARGEVTRARADLEDGVSRLQRCAARDGVEDARVGEQVLALRLVQLESPVPLLRRRRI
jgi:hypothetical protein